METKVAYLALKNGKKIIFEDTSNIQPTGEQLVSIANLPEIDFEAALETIKSTANQLVDTLISIDNRPDECELEFGIKLSAAAGAILAKAGADASFTVKLKWHK